ncbi:hypothetical protein DPEC_G00021820 [Dallia pectoralis]|uniref:Uncharacterized protein n=1 Tax=Dallia pectoralis TaxID=75939 RepID=A0ACC2HH04_DALPE|nr:hypothetical protein DPEC_G00021820 [Dallia pectoralis]
MEGEEFLQYSGSQAAYPQSMICYAAPQQAGLQKTAVSTSSSGWPQQTLMNIKPLHEAVTKVQVSPDQTLPPQDLDSNIKSLAHPSINPEGLGLTKLPRLQNIKCWPRRTSEQQSRPESHQTSTSTS